MSRIRVVYVSGPISAETADGVLANVHRAMEVAAKLRDAGLGVILPHLSVYWDRRCPAPYERWMAMDFILLEAADALLRLAPSPGTDREVAHAAARGIPVFFRVSDVLEAAKK